MAAIDEYYKSTEADVLVMSGEMHLLNPQPQCVVLVLEFCWDGTVHPTQELL